MDRANHDGIPVYRVHRTGLYVDNREKSLAPEVENCLLEVLKIERPDLVHVHHWIRLTRTLIETCHQAGIPAVCTLHDLWTTCPIAFRVRENTLCTRPVSGESCFGCAPASQYMAEDEVKEELDLFRDDHKNEVQLARRIIVPSNAHRDALMPHLPDLRGRFRVVPHGNLSVLARGSGTAGNFPNSPVLHVAHWGHLTTFKGIDLLLEAVKGLDAERFPVHLHLFGEVVYPSEQESVAKLSEGLAITWHGAYKPADLVAVPMDLAVIPSRCSESWSFVLDATRSSTPGARRGGPDRSSRCSSSPSCSATAWTASGARIPSWASG
jgi:glycosyltransferase involved in cell wall biosynthesis